MKLESRRGDSVWVSARDLVENAVWYSVRGLVRTSVVDAVWAPTDKAAWNTAKGSIRAQE